MNFSKLMLICLFTASGPMQAYGDATTDLIALTAKTRTVVGNAASIDAANAESAKFNTNMVGQLVELSLTGRELNDSFLTAINYGAPSLKKRRIYSATNIEFGDLKIELDGCDITSKLLEQCTSTGCWDSAITPVPTTTLGGKFDTKIHLNLSALNPTTVSGCAIAQSSFFHQSDMNHTLSFQEEGAEAGGTLSYQVIIYQTTAE